MPCHPWLCYDIIPFWSLAHLPHVGLLSSVDDCSSFFTSFSVCTCAHMHAHTHKIHQPNRNQFMPFLCLKLWNGFPKYSKKKKKNPSSYHGLQGPARPDPHLTHHLMYLPDRFHFWSTYTQHPFHSSLQGLCTIFPHMKVLVAQLYLETIDSSPLRLLHPWEFSSKNTSPIYTPENKLY